MRSATTTSEIRKSFRSPRRAKRPAAFATSIPVNIAKTCGTMTTLETAPLKRAIAGRWGKRANCPSRSSRTWYSTLPAGGWCGRAVLSVSPSRTIGSAANASFVG
ncbi:MAG: hypothetical protein IPN03_10020 [Holophagales bacterium]|nr:hypothetical protein [Holophagales bacterium]